MDCADKAFRQSYRKDFVWRLNDIDTRRLATHNTRLGASMEAWKMKTRMFGKKIALWAMMVCLLVSVCMGALAETAPWDQFTNRITSGQQVEPGALGEYAEWNSEDGYLVSFYDLYGQLVGWAVVPEGYYLLELEGYPHIDGLVFEFWYDAAAEEVVPFEFGHPVSTNLDLVPYYSVGYTQQEAQAPVIDELEVNTMVGEILGSQIGESILSSIELLEPQVVETPVIETPETDEGSLFIPTEQTNDNDTAQVIVTQSPEEAAADADLAAQLAESLLQSVETTPPSQVEETPEAAPEFDLGGLLMTPEQGEQPAEPTAEPTATAVEEGQPEIPLGASILDILTPEVEGITEGEVPEAEEGTDPAAEEAPDLFILTETAEGDEATEEEPTEEEPTEEAEEEPEEQHPAGMVLVTCAFEGDQIEMGSALTLTAELINFPENADVQYQWQNDISGTFEDVPGATGKSHTFYADGENIRCSWQVRTWY